MKLKNQENTLTNKKFKINVSPKTPIAIFDRIQNHFISAK